MSGRAPLGDLMASKDSVIASHIFCHKDSIDQHGLISIAAWISNYTHQKVWHQMTYPLPNLNGAVIDDREWKVNFIPQCTVSNFTLHFTGHVITYSYRDLKSYMSVKGVPAVLILHIWFLKMFRTFEKKRLIAMISDQYDLISISLRKNNGVFDGP